MKTSLFLLHADRPPPLLMLAVSVGEQFLYLLLGRHTLGLEKCVTKVQSQAPLSVWLHEPWRSGQLYFRHAVTAIISVKPAFESKDVCKGGKYGSFLSLSLCLLICYNSCCCAGCVRLSHYSSSAYLPTFEIYK